MSAQTSNMSRITPRTCSSLHLACKTWSRDSYESFFSAVVSSTVMDEVVLCKRLVVILAVVLVLVLVLVLVVASSAWAGLWWKLLCTLWGLNASAALASTRTVTIHFIADSFFQEHDTTRSNKEISITRNRVLLDPFFGSQKRIDVKGTWYQISGFGMIFFLHK